MISARQAGRSSRSPTFRARQEKAYDVSDALADIALDEARPAYERQAALEGPCHSEELRRSPCDEESAVAVAVAPAALRILRRTARTELLRMTG